MHRFVEVVPIALTPLTPIHIGCGEDFEPTNYVIDDGVLYYFEPTRLSLTDIDRERLIKEANRKADEAIRAIQKFFYEKRRACREASRLAVPVAAGVTEWYEGRVGRVAQREAGGRTVSNQLEIERTAHHPHTGKPYLPGSSLKGSMRTGWLNDLDKGPPVRRTPDQGPRESSVKVEADLLGGDFKSDPFRLINVSDAASRDVQSRVVFAVDRRKQPRHDRSGGRVEAKDLFVRREAICGGQIRVLQGEIRFKSLPASVPPQDVPAPGKRISDFATLARACNRFYRSRLEADLEVLAALGEVQWTSAFQSLIAALKPALEEGNMMLLRVGRHSGAESVTLDRHRWIRIMEGRGRAHWARDATTIWLAADRTDSSSDLRPFGWLLIERADNLLPNDPLNRWCDQEMHAFARSPSSGAIRPSSAVPSSTGAQPEQAVRGPLRREDKVIYQGEPAIIREIDGTEARIEFEGGDTEWVPLDKLTRS